MKILTSDIPILVGAEPECHVNGDPAGVSIVFDDHRAGKSMRVMFEGEEAKNLGVNCISVLAIVEHLQRMQQEQARARMMVPPHMPGRG